MDSSGEHKPMEQQGSSKKRNRKRRWYKERANRNGNRIKKAKDLREELLKLQEYMNDKYHSS